jgi:hypothetical protein
VCVKEMDVKNDKIKVIEFGEIITPNIYKDKEYDIDEKDIEKDKMNKFNYYRKGSFSAVEIRFPEYCAERDISLPELPEYDSNYINDHIDGIPSNGYININMMPFIINDPKSIPEKFGRYSEYIDKVLKCVATELTGTIGYLTIQESFVKKDKTQRRPGLHVDAPRIPLKEQQYYSNGTYSWGGGLHGGIILSSNVSDSLEIYPCVIKDDDLIGYFGDVSNIKELLPKSVKNEANKVYMITDHTPHESLPVEESCVRQFFRIVVGKVDVWYKLHSTENELGIKPNESTRIIHDNKFT